MKCFRGAAAGLLGVSLLILLWRARLRAGKAGGARGRAAETSRGPRRGAPRSYRNRNPGGLQSVYLSGLRAGKDTVVFQPGLSASYGGFSASFWGNIDSDEHGTPNFVPDRDGKRSFNETDLTLSYTKVFGRMSLTGGWIYYGTKYTDETQEAFGTVSYDVIGKPTLSIYRDFDRYPGTYFNLSLSHSIKVVKDITLDLGASAGYMWGTAATGRPLPGRTTAPFTMACSRQALPYPCPRRSPSPLSSNIGSPSPTRRGRETTTRTAT